MEEEERYEWDSIESVEWIRDTKIGYLLNRDDMKKLADLLNQQDKQIKELENMNSRLSQGIYWGNGEHFSDVVKRLKKENQQLNQQLHDLPKKIVGDIRDDMSKRIMEKQIKWGDNIQIGFICNAINECLDTILKKFGGKDE